MAVFCYYFIEYIAISSICTPSTPAIAMSHKFGFLIVSQRSCKLHLYFFSIIPFSLSDWSSLS
jgi:hypothetical protein